MSKDAVYIIWGRIMGRGIVSTQGLERGRNQFYSYSPEGQSYSWRERGCMSAAGARGRKPPAGRVGGDSPSCSCLPWNKGLGEVTLGGQALCT